MHLKFSLESERGKDVERDKEETQLSPSPIDLCQYFCINKSHSAILQVSTGPSVMLDCAWGNLGKLLFRHNEDMLDTTEERYDRELGARGGR